MPSGATRTEKLVLHFAAPEHRALQAAAQACGRPVAEFVLASALDRADELLADRRRFILPEEQWQQFLTALDAPPRPLPRLKRLLETPGFFDSREGQ